jgi:hypothetical protein
MVSGDPASGNALNNLLRIVHKYPLLEYNYDQPDGLSSLRKQVITAAEQYLGGLFSSKCAILHYAESH